ncbi:MAG: HEAT repeat domain-containing protein [Myxococcales bacterium]|nr:HEAT repeat domain-containing protein [Myxococcales bacterium]
MKSSNLKLRLQAVFVLGRLRDDRSIPALVQALDDKSETVRSLAAYALGQIGDARANGALRRSMHDRSAQVRRHARAALKHIREARAAPAKRLRSARYLLKLGKMSVRQRMGSRSLAQRMRDVWQQEINSSSSAAVMGQGRPRRHQKIYGLTSALTQLSQHRRGGTISTTCRVSMVLSGKAGNIVMMGSGGATVEASSRSRGGESSLKDHALRAAIQSAKRNLMRYLRSH